MLCHRLSFGELDPPILELAEGNSAVVVGLQASASSVLIDAVGDQEMRMAVCERFEQARSWQSSIEQGISAGMDADFRRQKHFSRQGPRRTEFWHRPPYLSFESSSCYSDYC